MAAFEVIALDTATPQLRAPGASDTYTFPRAVEMPLGTANGVLFLNGSKVVTSGSALTFDGTTFGVTNASASLALSATKSADGNVAFFRRVGGTYNPGMFISLSDTTNNEIIFNSTYSSGSPPSFVWQNSGSEQMRLTGTGLGIGTSSPGAKLQVLATGKATIFGSATAQNSYSAWQYNGADVGYIGNAAGVVGAAGATDFGITAFTGGKLWLGANNGTGTTYAVLDSSGNLGLGVTPSAWVSNRRVLEIGGGAAALALNGSAAVSEVFANAIRDTGGAYRYFANGAASYVDFNNSSAGGWSWSIAPSGTAGNAISFSQAMTLDASGRLLIGQTAEKTQEVVRVAGSGQASMLLDNTGKTNGAFVGVFNDSALFGVNRNPSTGVFYNTSNYAAEIIAVGSSTTSYIAFGTTTAANTTPTERARIPAAGGMVVGTAALATTATDGFLYVPTCAGTPTGTPTTQTGTAPIVINTTNNKLYFYSGGAWRDAGP